MNRFQIQSIAAAKPQTRAASYQTGVTSSRLSHAAMALSGSLNKLTMKVNGLHALRGDYKHLHGLKKTLATEGLSRDLIAFIGKDGQDFLPALESLDRVIVAPHDYRIQAALDKLNEELLIENKVLKVALEEMEAIVDVVEESTNVVGSGCNDGLQNLLDNVSVFDAGELQSCQITIPAQTIPLAQERAEKLIRTINEISETDDDDDLSELVADSTPYTGISVSEDGMISTDTVAEQDPAYATTTGLAVDLGLSTANVEALLNTLNTLNDCLQGSSGDIVETEIELYEDDEDENPVPSDEPMTEPLLELADSTDPVVPEDAAQNVPATEDEGDPAMDAPPPTPPEFPGNPGDIAPPIAEEDLSDDEDDTKTELTKVGVLAALTDVGYSIIMSVIATLEQLREQTIEV